MKGKSSYTRKELMKKVPKEYHSEINVFLKQNIDILPDYRDEDHKIELLKGKQTFLYKTISYCQNKKQMQ